MSAEPRLTGRVIRAARALAGIGQSDFAQAAGLSSDELCAVEAGGSAFVEDAQAAAALHRALRHFGVLVIEEGGGLGAGVRLKFNRLDVRQMARLENEGGIVGSDDAP